MAKNKGLGLPQTKGSFQLRGYTTGLLRDNAFKSIQTKNNKEMNIVNFGIKTNDESTTYTQILGMEQDYVYFYKKAEEKGKKGTTKKVAWDKRFEDQGEGFQLIGVRLGLARNEDGKNVTETMTEYDGAEKIYNDLSDDTSVFCVGEIDFKSYETKEGETRKQKNFAIKQLYLAKDINFEDFEDDDKNIKEESSFKQTIIYMDSEIVKDKEDPRMLISAKIVDYNNIQDTEFVIRKKDLANTFKTKLKPYTAIDVWGKIINKIKVDEEQKKGDFWGEEDPTKNVRNNYIRELEIIGANPQTIDTETYTKEKIDEALRADKEYGDNNNDEWVSVKDGEDDSTDSLPWD